MELIITSQSSPQYSEEHSADHGFMVLETLCDYNTQFECEMLLIECYMAARQIFRISNLLFHSTVTGKFVCYVESITGAVSQTPFLATLFSLDAYVTPFP